MMKTIYLDHNATCPLDQQVINSVSSALIDFWANPSSDSESGRRCKEKVEQCRTEISRMINCQPFEIVFTSGGTEANNLVITSTLEYFRDFKNRENDRNEETKAEIVYTDRPHIITSSIEHDSIKLPLEYYNKRSLIDLTVLPVDKSTGYFDLGLLRESIRPNTCLVTVMLANNETGVIQPMGAVGRIIREINRSRRLKVLFHSDAAQAIGKISVDASDLLVDYLTIVGHKFYGPRTGALYAKAFVDPGNCTKDTEHLLLYPNLFGGGQERGFRPGTENTPMIVGLGEAARLVCNNIGGFQQHMREIRDYFEVELKVNSYNFISRWNLK